MNNYEMLSKFQTEEGFFEQVTSFLEWCEETHSITLKYCDAVNNPPVKDLLFEYTDIDKQQLEQERRQLLKEQSGGLT